MIESQKISGVIFLGEQDGQVERELKAALADFLPVHRTISLVYLARVSYRETPGSGVALCLRGGSEDAPVLVAGIGEVFKKLFNPTQHLDILFLSDSQVSELERVAKPFYTVP